MSATEPRSALAQLALAQLALAQLALAQLALTRSVPPRLRRAHSGRARGSTPRLKGQSSYEARFDSSRAQLQRTFPARFAAGFDRFAELQRRIEQLGLRDVAQMLLRRAVLTRLERRVGDGIAHVLIRHQSEPG